jgi:hypothetical protein
MSKHRSKAFTLYVNDKTALDQLIEIGHGIPFFQGLNIKHSSFFSLPLISSFLRIYGTQICTVYRSKEEGGYVVPKEVAFYCALPNLTQLSTRWLGDSVPDVKLPALERLQLLTVRSTWSERAAKVNFDFLLNFPNLTHLWLTNVLDWDDNLEVLSALGQYLAIRNVWEESSRKLLTIFVDSYGTVPHKLNLTEKEKLATLLQELAVADGRILIENMPVTLLDEAVHIFRCQRGEQLLKSFGKCIRSLDGVSSSLYEVELPNMRKFTLHWVLNGTMRDGDFSRTVSWPKLEEVRLYIGGIANDLSYTAKLVFGSGVLRPSVQTLEVDLNLLPLGSTEGHLLLGNFPNLTHLTLRFDDEDVGLFRSLMRVLPTSCSKIQFLEIISYFPLGDEDFLGVDGERLNLTLPLLQFPGK